MSCSLDWALESDRCWVAVGYCCKHGLDNKPIYWCSSSLCSSFNDCLFTPSPCLYLPLPPFFDILNRHISFNTFSYKRGGPCLSVVRMVCSSKGPMNGMTGEDIGCITRLMCLKMHLCFDTCHALTWVTQSAKQTPFQYSGTRCKKPYIRLL